MLHRDTEYLFNSWFYFSLSDSPFPLFILLLPYHFDLQIHPELQIFHVPICRSLMSLPVPFAMSSSQQTPPSVRISETCFPDQFFSMFLWLNVLWSNRLFLFAFSVGTLCCYGAIIYIKAFLCNFRMLFSEDPQGEIYLFIQNIHSLLKKSFKNLRAWIKISVHKSSYFSKFCSSSVCCSNFYWSYTTALFQLIQAFISN